MQLKETSTIRRALTLATCTLLGSTSAIAETGDWGVDTAVLFYNETGRVKVVEPAISATRDYGDEKKLNLKLAYDSLTGASANGAVPSDQAQTFTRTSGKGQYTTQAGQTPLDSTFKDRRVGLSVGWEQPLDRLYKTSFGLSASKETDYSSLGVNSVITRDFNNRNTTGTLGISFSNDKVEPKGGVPQAFATVGAAGAPMTNSERKESADLLLGLTQVVNRHVITQINYSLSRTNGYQTDPYKMVSLVASSGYAVQQLNESRPNTRTKHAIYWQVKSHLERDIVNFSYRYMRDDWDVKSHTMELSYRWKFMTDHYLEPYLRGYTQTQASFYTRFLVYGTPLPAYATADYRLGNLNTSTVGLKYGTQIYGHDFSATLTYYKQTSKSNNQAIGVLQKLDLDPTVIAKMLTLGYSF